MDFKGPNPIFFSGLLFKKHTNVQYLRNVNILDSIYEKGDNENQQLRWGGVFKKQLSMAHSSSGLGHVPLKDEITGSNPVCATKDKLTPCFEVKLVEKGIPYIINYFFGI